MIGMGEFGRRALGGLSGFIGAIAVVVLAAGAHAQSVQYDYDDLGRLISILHDDGTEIAYDYDPAGNRVSRVIYDPSAPPVITIEDAAAVDEGGSLGFTVVKAGASGRSHSVTWAVVGGNAVAGTHFVAASGTLEFAPSESSKTISVTTLANPAFGPDVTLEIGLSAPTDGAVLGTPAIATGTISNITAPPVFNIADAPAVDEGGTLGFTITKSGATTLSHSISYTTADGTAMAGSDYTVKSGTLVFAPGETSKTVVVTTLGDPVFENAETVHLDISAPTSGAVIGGPTRGTGSVTNTTAPPVFTVASATAVNEGGTLSFTVTRTGASGLTHGVAFATANGTAIAGTNYTAISGNLSFAPGETSKTVAVTTLAQNVFKDARTVHLDISAPTAGAILGSPVRGTGSINNTAAPPAFAIAGATITEGQSATLTITKSGATVFSHEVDYATATATAPNAAVSGVDFVAASGSLSFAAGETAKTIQVASTAIDGIFKADQVFEVRLAQPVGEAATVSGGPAQVVINDADPAPWFALPSTPLVVSEGNALAIAVFCNGATGMEVRVDYTLVSGTATAGTDFTAASGTLVFPPAGGPSSQTVTAQTLLDAVFDTAKNFKIVLSNPTVLAIDPENGPERTITVNEGDAPPSFKIANASAVNEGGTFGFTVTKTGATALSHSVSYATANGTAASGSDFTAKSGALTFAAGETSKTVSVATLTDSVFENGETVHVDIASPTAGAVLGSPSRGTGTINNTSAAPSFAISNASISEGGTLSFTVSKSGSTALSHNVSYATANGSAAAGSDYTAKSGTLSFTASQTSKTVTVATIEDSNFESNETALVNLSGATGGASIADA